MGDQTAAVKMVLLPEAVAATKSTPASVSYTGEGWVSMACTTCSPGAANSQTLPGRTDVTVLAVLACEPVNLLACMVDTS
jgi:hypothetical protein